MAITVFNKKFYKYMYLRLIRQGGTPHRLAMSVALGMFFGFVIPVGQMLAAILFAWIFKLNKVVSAACCWVTNPVTIPFLFPLNIVLGSYFISSELDLVEEFDRISNMKLWEGLKAFFALGAEGMLCFLVGGGIIGSVLALISYSFVYKLVTRHNDRKKERYLRKRDAMHLIHDKEHEQSSAEDKKDKSQ